MSMDIPTDSHGRPKPVAPRKRAADSRAYGRTKISNGSVAIAGVNQRDPYVRRFKELVANYQADMPGATAAERSLVRRACILEIELERLETGLAGSDKASQRGLDLYARTVGNLRRVLQALGLGSKRQSKRDDAPGPLGRLLIADIERQQREKQHE
jgi:hypothetical protein